LVSCGSRAGDLGRLPRSLPPTQAFSSADGSGMVFEAGAAYLRGSDARRKLGDWVAGVPGEGWPADLEKPNLALGRVVERGPLWARVELLAAVDSIRQPALEVVELAPSTRALTKRSTFSLLVGEEVSVPIGSADLVTGDELYGVLPAHLQPDLRLGAQLVGLVRLAVRDSHSSVVEEVAGDVEWLGGETLVLLGMKPSRPHPVQITLTPVVDAQGQAVDLLALKDELERRLGVTKARIRVEDEAVGVEEASQFLGRPQSDSLGILVHAGSDASGDPIVYVRSQIERVHPKACVPWWPRTSVVNVSTLADALQLHTAQLRGNYALVAFLSEELLRRPEMAEVSWEQLGPCLVEAYLETWRRDWATEAYSHLAAVDKATNSDRMGQATLVAALELGRALEVEGRVSAVERTLGDDLDSGLIVSLSDFYEARHQPNESRRWRHKLNGDGHDDFDRFTFLLEELEGQLLRDEALDHDVVAKADKFAQNLGDLAQIHLKALSVLEATRDSRILSEGLLGFVDEVDHSGAPGVAFTVLVRASRYLIETDESAARAVVVEAAAFALVASRPLWALSVLSRNASNYFDSALAVPKSPMDGTLLYLAACLDQRLLLARESLSAAREAADADPARDSLELALDLFLDIGDELNLALTFLQLANLEMSQGRLDEASLRIEEARRFEGSLRDSDVALLRQNLEKRLHGLRAAPSNP